MGWFSVLICVISIFFLYITNHLVLCILATINTVLNFWSFGVMHNYAIEVRREKVQRLRDNLKAEGRLDDEAEERIYQYQRKIPLNPQAIPNWLAKIDLASSIFGFGLFIYGIFLYLKK